MRNHYLPLDTGAEKSFRVAKEGNLEDSRVGSQHLQTVSVDSSPTGKCCQNSVGVCVPSTMSMSPTVERMLLGRTGANEEITQFSNRKNLQTRELFDFNFEWNLWLF